jgi:prevent-host-death family protein
MRKIGTPEFKNRMGRYLAAVKWGQSLLIMSRSRAVAKVTPAEPEDSSIDSIKPRLMELEAQGLVHLARESMGPFKAVRTRGKLASEMLLEDRRW